MNVGDEYSGRSRKRGHRHFRDAHVSISGPAGRRSRDYFRRGLELFDDEASRSPRFVTKADGDARWPSCRAAPIRSNNASALIYFTGVTLARKRCYITTPYFIPDRADDPPRWSRRRARRCSRARPSTCLVGLPGRRRFKTTRRRGESACSPQYFASIVHLRTIGLIEARFLPKRPI